MKDVNDTKEIAQKYARVGIEKTYYLGYRDIPFLVKKYVVGNKALDYGCGSGRSSRFLTAQGLFTLGVDISHNMLSNIKNDRSNAHYIHINKGQIPVLDETYDLVFSGFVLFTVSNKKELSSIFSEAYRCLKKDGIFIVVTGSEEMFSHEWLSYDTNYPENKQLFSGSTTKIQIKDLGVEFINYYWTDSDYTSLLESVGFDVLEKHFPLGSKDDEQVWISELDHAPYVVYVAKK